MTSGTLPQIDEELFAEITAEQSPETVAAVRRLVQGDFSVAMPKKPTTKVGPSSLREHHAAKANIVRLARQYIEQFHLVGEARQQRFEDALLQAFPDREDIQDFVRLQSYTGFDPQVDSYEDISDEEFDKVAAFLAKQRSELGGDAVPSPRRPREPDSKFESFLAERMASMAREAEVARLAYYLQYRPRLNLAKASADEVERGYDLCTEYRRQELAATPEPGSRGEEGTPQMEESGNRSKEMVPSPHIVEALRRLREVVKQRATKSARSRAASTASATEFVAHPAYLDTDFEALIETELPEVQLVARVAYYAEDAPLPAASALHREPRPGEVARILGIVESYLSSKRSAT